MTLLKTILQYLLSIPLILLGDIRDPYIDGALCKAHGEEDADG